MAGKSLVELFEEYKANPRKGWIDDYKADFEKAQRIRNGEEALDESFVKKLWTGVSTGVTHIRRGKARFSSDDFNKRKDFLIQTTKDILSNPFPAHYSKLLDSWRNAKDKPFIPYALLGRIFATADPTKYSSIVNRVTFDNLLNDLKKKKYISEVNGGDWASKNEQFLEELRRKFDIFRSADPIVLNTFLWWLYDNNKEIAPNPNSQPLLSKIMKNKYELWDEFSKRWPLSKVKSMTLSEYSSVGDKDCFTYWIENKLEELGSIWGGSAFKFGVFNRKDQTEMQNKNGRSYSKEYAWYSKYGETSDEAYAAVHEKVVAVIEAAQKGDLLAIHKIDLGSAYKWKIAFLYQDKSNPCIINLFTGRYFLPFFGMNLRKKALVELQRLAMEKRGDKELFKYSEEIIDVYRKRLNSSEDEEGNPLLPRSLNTIFYGPPGTGKTHELIKLKTKAFTGKSNDQIGVDIERYEFVTFHQSYSYEEFVEGIRPVLSKPEDLDSGLRYTLVSGVFKDICKRAENDPGNDYALFIDEINRGNISKIFGELITLIEDNKRRDYREKEKTGLEVTLPYSKESFAVPANLYIIGSMNTADRSLALMDTALRRRFTFKEKMPELSLVDLVVKAESVEISIQSMLEIMNKRIEALYDREHMLGHAFFMGDDWDSPSIDVLAEVFQYKIIPLLQEYFFDDWEKIRLVLGDNQKTHESAAPQFILKVEDEQIFGEDEDNGFVRYKLNSDAFLEPNSYVQIYAPYTEKKGNS